MRFFKSQQVTGYVKRSGELIHETRNWIKQNPITRVILKIYFIRAYFRVFRRNESILQVVLNDLSIRWIFQYPVQFVVYIIRR